jgi:hypothetical protein
MTLGTQCTGAWVGRRAGLDTEARGKILSPLPGIEPRPLARPNQYELLLSLLDKFEQMFQPLNFIKILEVFLEVRH